MSYLRPLMLINGSKSALTAESEVFSNYLALNKTMFIVINIIEDFGGITL